MMFVFPCEEYEDKAKNFIEEFYQYNSDINGTGALDRYLSEDNYQEWLKKVLKDIDLANIQKGRVPAYTYFYVREEDQKIIGMINIRLELNEFQLKEGGQIGYCIRPTERRKGYGTQMLREALQFLKRIGINKVLITCDATNYGSAKIAMNCGGILENEFYSETFKVMAQRYWIEI